MWCAEASSNTNIIIRRGRCSCRFNKIVALINSARLPRVSVIRSPASWFGKCDCPRKSLRATESQWHKDGEGCFRGWDEQPLGSSSTTSSRRGGPPSNIHELPNAGSPPRQRRPPPVSNLLPFLHPPRSLPLTSLALPSFLPLLSTSGGNLATSPRSILAKRPHGIDFNLGFADLFRPRALTDPREPCAGVFL